MNWISPIKLYKNWRFEPIDKKPATIEVQIMEETVKTIQVNYKNQTVWLQKSIVKFSQQEENKVTITMPLWLFTRKFPKPLRKSKESE